MMGVSGMVSVMTRTVYGNSAAARMHALLVHAFSCQEVPLPPRIYAAHNYLFAAPQRRMRVRRLPALLGRRSMLQVAPFCSNRCTWLPMQRDGRLVLHVELSLHSGALRSTRNDQARPQTGTIGCCSDIGGFASRQHVLWRPVLGAPKPSRRNRTQGPWHGQLLLQGFSSSWWDELFSRLIRPSM